MILKLYNKDENKQIKIMHMFSSFNIWALMRMEHSHSHSHPTQTHASSATLILLTHCAHPHAIPYYQTKEALSCVLCSFFILVLFLFINACAGSDQLLFSFVLGKVIVYINIITQGSFHTYAICMLACALELA